ncbi:hypothetical protein ABE096_12395 [Robertmurraya massiliosenegalensis]|uniref:hypothetical protein n=1 Tax=Robertmurraya TaxID=2837507 RepID=UPI0039A46F62
MINQLLNTMYNLNIKIKEKDNKTKLIYEHGLIDDGIKEQIKLNKKELLQWIDENETARKIGFLVYNHGQLYEYRFGRGSYLFVERLPNGKASSWRENYKEGDRKAYRTKSIVQNVPFERAFEEAASFIDWLNKKRGKKVG